MRNSCLGYGWNKITHTAGWAGCKAESWNQLLTQCNIRSSCANKIRKRAILIRLANINFLLPILKYNNTAIFYRRGLYCSIHNNLVFHIQILGNTLSLLMQRDSFTACNYKSSFTWLHLIISNIHMNYSFIQPYFKHGIADYFTLPSESLEHPTFWTVQ